jgi:hypothetical protein
MSYQEINSKYLAKTRKAHRCEWCGERIDIGEEAWYWFYRLEGATRSAYMHCECKAACEKAYADPGQEIALYGWEAGKFARGEYVSREDLRYPHRSVWAILRQVEAFDRVKAGDRICSSLQPKNVRVVENADVEMLWLVEDLSVEGISKEEWVLDDWKTCR